MSAEMGSYDATSAIVDDIKARWIWYIENIHVRDDVPLYLRIDSFATMIFASFNQIEGLESLFWLSVFTAILESKTHTADEVNEAARMLRPKYVTKQNRLLKPLDTKIKRVGAVMLVIGLVFLTIGSIQLFNDMWRLSNFFPYLWESLSLSGRRYHDYWMAAQGVYLTCLGLMLSYAYDRTTGRLIKWIKSAPN